MIDSAADVTDPICEKFGDGAGDVLDDLASLDLAETPPVEVVSELQRLQDALDDGG